MFLQDAAGACLAASVIEEMFKVLYVTDGSSQYVELGQSLSS